MKYLKFRYLFALYAFVLSYICIFQIYPAYDDWTYASPKPGMNIIAGIMPTPLFWRPFDRLVEYALGYAPFLFPCLNNILRLSGHFFLCITLYAVLKKLTGSKRCSMTGAFFFCLSPGILTTVTNTDYINQVWAMLSGIISVFFFFKADISRKSRYYALWILFAFVSIFWKENGIVWFLAPIMLNITYSFMKGEDIVHSVKSRFVYIIAGLAGMILYFSVRFYLMGSCSTRH